MKRSLLVVFIIATILIGVHVTFRMFMPTAIAPTDFSGEVTVENISKGGGADFEAGDNLRVSYFIKNPNLLQKLLIALQKNYQSQFGFKEGSLLVNGKPYNGETLTMTPGDDPIHISYEVIAKGSTGNPTDLVQVQTTEETVEPAPLVAGSPSITYCPEKEIIHNSDYALLLQGNNLQNVTKVSIGTLELTPNKTDTIMMWVNIPATTLPDGMHKVTLDTENSTIETDCSLQVHTYTHPIVQQVTPSEIPPAKAARVMLQGELLHTVTRVRLVQNGTTVQTTFELLDPKVMSIIIPATIAQGTYTINLETTSGIYTTPPAYLTVLANNQ